MKNKRIDFLAFSKQGVELVIIELKMTCPPKTGPPVRL
jgi:hypothetical protein